MDKNRLGGRQGIQVAGVGSEKKCCWVQGSEKKEGGSNKNEGVRKKKGWESRKGGPVPPESVAEALHTQSHAQNKALDPIGDPLLVAVNDVEIPLSDGGGPARFSGAQVGRKSFGWARLMAATSLPADGSVMFREMIFRLPAEERPGVRPRLAKAREEVNQVTTP